MGKESKQRQPLGEQSLHRARPTLTMADHMGLCQHCSQKILPRKNNRGLDKRALSLKLRRQDVSVYEALKNVYLYEGPSSGYLCGPCYLELERAYRVFRDLATPSTPKKRKDRTPSKISPKKTKKVRCSPARPRTPKQGVSFHHPMCSSTPITHSRSLFPISPLPSILIDKSTSQRKRQTPSKFSQNLRRITSLLSQSKYLSAFRQILNRSPNCAGKAFVDFFQVEICKEVRAFAKKQKRNSWVLQGIHSILQFSWEDILKETEKHMPTLYAALHGAMGLKPGKEVSKHKCKGTNIQPRIGLMLYIALYFLNPRKFKLIQQLCSVQMWRSGGSEKLFKAFNHLGICQSNSSTRRLIDILCQEIDIEMKKYKDALDAKGDETNDMTGMQESSAVPSSTLGTFQFQHDSESDDSDFLPMMNDIDETINTTATSVLTQESTIENDCSYEIKDERVGYAFVWDNIQKLSQTRDSSYGQKNMMHLWANAYAAVNRVEPTGLDDNDLILQCSQIPLTAFLHSAADEQMLRHRLMCVTSRIIVKQLKHFRQYYEDVVTWHIPHTHFEEMTKKSKIINIGIIHENPSTRAGTMGIMLELQKYVPRRKDGSFRVVPCHGDGLSVERMTDAKKARAADVSDISRLQGLEQTPQECHHRGLMLQETINVAFKGRSIGERGTLAQLRNAFCHHNATTDVMNSFNSVENMIRFTTEAHVVYLAMFLLGMDAMDASPTTSDPTASKEDRKRYLEDLCYRIVDTVWLLPGQGDISYVLEAEVKGASSKWCICDREEDGHMVRCSNSDCPLGAWFHIACMEITEDEFANLADDWWCSVECQETGRSVLCFCKSIKLATMVPCAAGDDCMEGKLFHLDCVHLHEAPAPPWYCSSICVEKGGQQQDHVRNYAIALTWYGLLDLAHRDAIREGDGIAMLSMWRTNMIRFWQGNHYKYLIIAHRLLAGVNGWLPPRLIEEITHNRTCNLKGGPGHNIAMDRVNEFLNNEFKGVLSQAHGNYSNETVRRAGKMVGTLARAIDEAFHLQVADTELPGTYRKRHDYHDDIETFVQEYWEDDFFGNHPGREHPSFQGFSARARIKNPAKLKERLMKYNKKLDGTREVLH